MQTQEASRAAGPKPTPKECAAEGCRGTVEAFLRPGFAGQPAVWMIGDKCRACEEAEAAEYLRPPADPMANLAQWAALPPAAAGWSLASARQRAEAAKADPVDRALWLEAFNAAAGWDRLGRWLVLYGAPGLGKTSLGYALLNRHLQAEKGRAYFLPCLDLAPALGGDTGDRMLARAKEAGLLFLDGLGTVKATQRVWGALVGIVDARRRERRPTVITLDFAPAELPARLRDKNNALTMRITGKSELVSFTGRPFPELGAA